MYNTSELFEELKKGLLMWVLKGFFLPIVWKAAVSLRLYITVLR